MRTAVALLNAALIMGIVLLNSGVAETQEESLKIVQCKYNGTDYPEKETNLRDPCVKVVCTNGTGYEVSSLRRPQFKLNSFRKPPGFCPVGKYR
uniref:Hypothetical secreted protein 1871 n=1 Tax=Amblyomma variegatum TaxID=34610 RepID=F0J9Z6_AMBVA|nr:TPA_inf: hypothetical secreted protein 1871 [Amblyomma variegatum]